MAIVLFLAGGLMLPHDPAAYPAGLRHYFESDGRYGVLAFKAYFALSIFGNVTLGGYAPLRDPLDILMLVVIGSGVLFTRLKARRHQILATVIHGVLLLAAFFTASPAGY